MNYKEFTDSLQSDAEELVKFLTAALAAAQRMVITSTVREVAAQDLNSIEVELSNANRICREARKLIAEGTLEQDDADLLDSEPTSGRNAL